MKKSRKFLPSLVEGPATCYPYIKRGELFKPDELRNHPSKWNSARRKAVQPGKSQRANEPGTSRRALANMFSDRAGGQNRVPETKKLRWQKSKTGSQRVGELDRPANRRNMKAESLKGP